MPSSVTSLFASVGLAPGGCVPWATPLPERRTGVYVVSLSESADQVAGTQSVAPLSGGALAELISACPAITLDGETRPSCDQLAARMSAYWLPDEYILYVGLAGQPLRTRVGQYYKTPLGAAKPHKGGWWLKTLSVLGDAHVHYAATAAFRDAEEEMLCTFAAGVSEQSRARLPPGEPVMPFANLRDGEWRRRRHGIANATSGTGGHQGGGATSRRAEPERETLVPAANGPRERSGKVRATPHHRSQKVTLRDIDVGQIRIPRGPSKSLLPAERCDVVVRLRGRELRARWDPRHGPPERSGVVRVGKAAAVELLAPGDVLALARRADSVLEVR